jgi:beta-lactam-binding protein with PASTA domain
MASFVIRKTWFSWAATAKNVVLPNVVGMVEEVALNTLAYAQNIGARTTAYSTGVINKGRVISTNPAAGDTAAMDSKTVAYVVSDGFNVTCTDVGDVLTAPAAHGIAEGDLVYLAALATTTGAAINTQYYAKNVTATTLQLAATPGGAALALTTNGTASIVRGIVGGPYA